MLQDRVVYGGRSTCLAVYLREAEDPTGNAKPGIRANLTENVWAQTVKKMSSPTPTNRYVWAVTFASAHSCYS